MTPRTVHRSAAAILTVVVLVASCASDSSDDTDSASVELDSGRSDDGVEAEDAEGRLADDRDATDATDAMTEGTEAMEDSAPDDVRTESGEAASPTADAEEPGGASDSSIDTATDDDGPFQDESVPDEPPGDEDRFDDNRFEDSGYRDFVGAADDPLSTFALDVDTGSYTVGRRFLDEGSLPPRESVRPEEYVNAFDYSYDTPRDGLEISVDGGPSPFDEENVLVRVGVQGEVVNDEDRGRAALTFVIDTSGSMDRDDRLGLVKESLTILVDELDDDDTVAIVTYSDDSGIVLEPTDVADRDVILDAIDDLGPGGSTNLEAGLREGYRLARDAFDENGINRVVLASDGVANSGVTDPDALAAMIRDDADDGIDLVTVGFGMGNFDDVTMEQLADNGDGFYAYVDTEAEAERLFEDELTSTLLTVAKDAKIQVEFDDAVVESYRLVGFENRGVRDSDFRDDGIDAGELGAGHQVTALYEIRLVEGIGRSDRAELGVVALRWEDPGSAEVIEIDEDIDMRDIEAEWADTHDDLRLATIVATFAEKMRDNPHADDVDIDALASEAERIAGVLDTSDVRELAALIARAADLT